jgi:hypothetical protein
VKEEWSEITTEMAAKYVASIPTRLQKCLEVNGKMTKY